MADWQNDSQAEGSKEAVDLEAGSSDEQLMERVTRGDHAAFACLVNRHTPRMYGLARRVSGSPALAEDILQEAFLRLWVHAGTWNPQRGRFGVWFARIVVNLCIDRQREDRYESLEDEDSLVHEGEDPESALFLRQQAERVATAIMGLPLNQRTALALCYYQGFSNAEAADILGVTVGAVEALLIRGRRTLRGRLAPVLRF